MALRFIDKLQQAIAAYLSYKRGKQNERRAKNLIKKASLKLGKQPSEDEFVQLWTQLGISSSRYQFRLYSQFVQSSKEFILCQEAADLINNILNPKRYTAYFADKNVFDKIFPEGYLPKTFFRVVGGIVFNDAYEQEPNPDSKISEFLNGYDKPLILKPTLSDSGRGVRRYNPTSEGFVDAKSGSVLSFKSLTDDDNLILQECLQQNDFMSKLCSSSINTFRIAVYQSVVDGQPKILSAVIRIGCEGAIVDNLHQGGRMIRVDERTGELAKFCIDQYGNKYDCHNGIDFGTNNLFVPCWNEIITFAMSVIQKVTFARLLQLDIMLDKDNKPRLVEFNCSAFSMWIAQFTGTVALGKYSEEIFDYCKNQISSKINGQ